MDLIPEYERSVLNAAVKHAEPPIVKVSSRIVGIFWNLLLLCYLWGTGVFILYFAYTRMENIQVIWGFTFLGWFLLDFVLVQTSHAFLRYHWCTNWCKRSVAAAISVIKQKLMSIHNEPDCADSVPGETNPLRMGDASNRLNLVLFSSAQIIAHFLKLGVTQSRAMDLIAKFGSPFPQYRLVVRENDSERFVTALKSFLFHQSFIMIFYTRIPPRLGSYLLGQVVVMYWCGVLYLVMLLWVGSHQGWHLILLGFALLCLLWLFSKDLLLGYSHWLEGRMDDFIDENGLIGAAPGCKAVNNADPAFMTDDVHGAITTRDIETMESNPRAFGANLGEGDNEVEPSSEITLTPSGTLCSPSALPHESAVLGTSIAATEEDPEGALTNKGDFQLQLNGVSALQI
jgi:hypothetical protein